MLVQKTNNQPHLLAKFLMTVLVVRFIHSRIDSRVVVKSTFSRHTIQKFHLFVPGVIFLIESSPLV